MDACALAEAELPTPLTTDEALSVVEPYFEEMRRLYLDAGLRRVAETKLYCAPWMHDTPRHFAGCRDDGKVIVFAPELADQDEAVVAGILAHELGHAADFLYPGEFALRGREVVRRAREAAGDEQWQRWVRGWQGRDDDAVELTADGIAEWVTGARIGYSGPCHLQVFNRGVARPMGLR